MDEERLKAKHLKQDRELKHKLLDLYSEEGLLDQREPPSGDVHALGITDREDNARTLPHLIQALDAVTEMARAWHDEGLIKEGDWSEFKGFQKTELNHTIGLLRTQLAYLAHGHTSAMLQPSGNKSIKNHPAYNYFRKKVALTIVQMQKALGITKKKARREVYKWINKSGIPVSENTIKRWETDYKAHTDGITHPGFSTTGKSNDQIERVFKDRVRKLAKDVVAIRDTKSKENY